MKLISFLFIVLVAACQGPRDPNAPQMTALRGMTLIDGSGKEPIANAVLVLRGETIVAAGPAAAVSIPEDARVIDYAGKTVIPGLISDHSHVGIVDGMDAGAQHYNRTNILRQLRQYESYGVTTVTALGINGSIFESVREEMHAGRAPGADLFGVVSGIGVPEGAPPTAMIPIGPDQLFRPASAEEARAAVRAMASRHTDLVKLWLDDFGGSLKVKMKPEVYAAVIAEAHAHGLRVAAHVHDLVDAKAIVQAGADILAHGVRDQPVDPELVSALKMKGVWYVATLSLDEATFAYAAGDGWTAEPFTVRGLQPAVRAKIADPAWREQTAKDPKTARARASLAMNLRNLKTLHDAGISIGFGSDSGATPFRVAGVSEHRELALMVQAGLTPLQAITIATRNAAALLALEDRGQLVASRKADFIVLDGDPTRDIANTKSIAAVWHRGKLAGP